MARCLTTWTIDGTKTHFWLDDVKVVLNGEGADCELVIAIDEAMANQVIDIMTQVKAAPQKAREEAEALAAQLAEEARLEAEAAAEAARLQAEADAAAAALQAEAARLQAEMMAQFQADEARLQAEAEAEEARKQLEIPIDAVLEAEAAVVDIPAEMAKIARFIDESEATAVEAEADRIFRLP